MSSVQQQLDEARKELLDLSLRNTLINYRTLKSRGLNVIDEVPAEVFRILVREGRKMSFLPAPDEEAEEQNSPVDDDELFEEMLELLRQPEDEEDGPAARHVDTKLQTPYSSARLQRRLLNTFYKARTFIEERGVNVLYLALGMLEWYEAPQSDTTRHAPLILVPVELTRTSVQARFRLIYSGEDIGDNLSLQAKLKAEFGLQLPELPDVEDLDVPSYFDAVDRAVSGKNRWNVDRDAIALGFFSFAKLLMYNDLDVTQWPEEARPDDHPVVRALLADGFDEPEARIEDEGHLDEHLHPEEVHHVMNADASQTLAMLDIKQGLNLVIQGPPGTGKSQTIANVIAEAIGQEKTVLFVSEKMAALEVVKRRLDNIHLGDACLELHSHKTRKKDVLQELERTLRLGRPKAEAHAQDLSVLQSTRSQLNAYCESVNARIGESGVTPFQAYGHLLRLERRWEDVERPPRLDASALRTWTAEQYQQREALTRQMESLVHRMGLPTEHPFWGSRRMVFLPGDKQPLVETAQAAHQATEDVLARSEHLATELGLAVPTARREVSILCRAARRAMDAPNLQDVQLATRAWQERRADLETLLTAGERHAELHATYDDLLIPDAWTQDILQVRQHLAAHGEKWWRFLIGDFRRAKATLAGLCQKPLPKAAEDRVAIADAILEAQRLQETVEEHESLGRDLFGAQWNDLESDWEVLRQITTWMQDLYADIDEGELPHGLIAFLSGGVDRDALEPAVTATEEALIAQSEQAQAIATMVELDEERCFGADSALLDQPLTTQAALFEGFAAHVDRLQEMVAFNHRAQGLMDEECGLIVELAVRWPEAGEHLVAALRYARYNALVERAMEERPILAQFDGATHDEVVETFRELDRLSLIHNRARLALAHWKSLPKRGVSGQMGVLRHEFQKKRRHLPIRQLMEKAGHAIQAIKPVFMMSPMSIATYLPPGSAEFDLVVFDEASQVKPVDAFGAILRGKQTVVVGDSKQLPPTSFFDSVTTDEDADTTTADLESVLGLFKAQGAPERMLRWHYRSRHESLITVSNREFYDNRLVTFPSPDADRQELGLRYHHLPDTYYDRGGRRANRGEAQVVAEAVMEHARTRPDWTLGVATFSTAQMQEVLDQLELLRRKDPSCESFFSDHEDEPFFVKNLENVQGDERDVIFISIGYGRDQDGKLTMNFGPLNRDGGERRLNVLITRARRRCEVFTNLRSDDIDLRRTKARGVVALKRYLQYAATGEMDMAVPTGDGPDSPFEEDVARALRQAGYAVEHQVGSAGFRIDLAVVDEARPGHYLLGIECDGATYHSARTARDRDRTRQSVLEGLGWTIHRIWSTDWFRNPERELKKVVRSIERVQARANDSEPTGAPERRGTQHTIHREAPEPEHNEPERPAMPPYEVVSFDLRYGHAPHEAPTSELAQLLRRVVEGESPVHFEEAARRVMAVYGVTRLGRRIRESLERAARYAVNQKWIEQEDDFLFDPKQEDVPVRDRSALDNGSRKIELIAPQEIEAAIAQVVRTSFGITDEEIPREVCRMLGFAQTSANMREHIADVISDMVESERLTSKNGHLILPE